ncbi:hypothetical protein Tsubulata_049497 [Turnera subulata]|uniref:Uncharacterized protein n=1 Tax=Turnera subulata TaxID=218843 RepID=A0A9Q0FPY2_9ROSI|nr:hypothetical protein Tsubulata_049497 [Turnera subulata]
MDYRPATTNLLEPDFELWTNRDGTGRTASTASGLSYELRSGWWGGFTVEAATLCAPSGIDMDCMNSGQEDADLRIVVDLCRKGVDLRKERSSSRSVLIILLIV